MLLGESVRWTCKVEIFSIIFNLASSILCYQSFFEFSIPPTLSERCFLLLIFHRIFEFELFIHMLVTDILVYVCVNHRVWNMLFHFCFFLWRVPLFCQCFLINIFISVFGAWTSTRNHKCSKFCYSIDWMEEACEFRSWAELIPDALGVIFTNLSLQERVTVIPRVCKSWANAVTGPYCWQEIDIKDWSNRCQPDQLDRLLEMLITRSSGSLRKLSVSGLQTESIFTFIAEK